MGHATRTTKLSLELGGRGQGGVNAAKRAALNATVRVLTQARSFYIDFFLTHADKLAEHVPAYSERHLEMLERTDGGAVRTRYPGFFNECGDW